MAITLADLLKPALRIAGITMLPGITPSDDQFGELIPALNRLMGSWNLDGHKIFSKSIAVYPLVNGQKIYTIGPGGDFNAPRPVFIRTANFLFPGTPTVRRHIHIAQDEEWSRLMVQDIAGAPPYLLYYDSACDSNGRASIYMAPQPPDDYTLELYTWSALKRAFVSTTDIVVLPDGYEQAIVTNLALEAAALYPRDAMLSPLAVPNAQKALSALKIMNARNPRLRSEAATMGRAGAAFGGTGLVVGAGGGITDVTWLDPISKPNGVLSTFVFRQTPIYASFNGLNQFVGVGYNVVGYRTLQFIDVNGLTIVPASTDSVKAAVSSGVVATSGGGGGGGATPMYIAVTGTPNGTTGYDGLATFTLASTPTFLALYNNGILQTPNVNYTLSGITITFLAPHIPVSGDGLLAEGTE